MPTPSPWPALLPDEPYTKAQFQCYINAYITFSDNVLLCEGTQEEREACANAHYQTYLSYLPFCDTQ